MTRCYVSIGSNIERETAIPSGLKALEQIFGHLIVSSIYETEPVGFTGDPFYNLVAGFDTGFDVKTVANQLRTIEINHGRPPDSKKFSSRKLDLDLILYGDAVINENSIQLPRKDIENYAFVLEPLAEIAPTLLHPELKISYAELWEMMPKTGIPQRKLDR